MDWIALAFALTLFVLIVSGRDDRLDLDNL